MEDIDVRQAICQMHQHGQQQIEKMNRSDHLQMYRCVRYRMFMLNFLITLSLHLLLHLDSIVSPRLRFPNLFPKRRYRITLSTQMHRIFQLEVRLLHQLRQVLLLRMDQNELQSRIWLWHGVQVQKKVVEETESERQGTLDHL